jgi:hypothetical protein
MIFYFIYEILLKKYNIKFPSECINKTYSKSKKNNNIILNEIVTIDTNNLTLYTVNNKTLNNNKVNTKKLKKLYKSSLDTIIEQYEEALYNEIETIV